MKYESNGFGHTHKHTQLYGEDTLGRLVRTSTIVDGESVRFICSSYDSWTLCHGKCSWWHHMNISYIRYGTNVCIAFQKLNRRILLCRQLSSVEWMMNQTITCCFICVRFVTDYDNEKSNSSIYKCAQIVDERNSFNQDCLIFPSNPIHLLIFFALDMDLMIDLHPNPLWGLAVWF